MDQQKKTNLIACEFKQTLKNVNDSSIDQLEFRSLESYCFKVNTMGQHVVTDNSYSEAIKNFVEKIDNRNYKLLNEIKTPSRLTSSTPFKKYDIKNSFNISGVASLDLTSVKKTELINDSDFESMDQDQYDDDDDESIKENINHEQQILNKDSSQIEGLIDSFSKPKKLMKIIDTKIISMSNEKFRKCSSPLKERKNKFKKLKQIKKKMNSRTALRHDQFYHEDKSPGCISAIDSIKQFENISHGSVLEKSENVSSKDDLSDFAYTQPNKTKSFEAFVKNLEQLSVSK